MSIEKHPHDWFFKTVLKTLDIIYTNNYINLL